MNDDEAYTIAKDAYDCAYPLVLEYLTIRQLTNFEAPTGIVGQGPVGQLSHATAFPPVDFRAVVRTNLETLYSIADLDLKDEPMVLSVPAVDRYFLLQMISLWSDVFAAPGSRTTGRNTARDFLVVGPRWAGDVPAGLELIRSPTRYVAIGGRTQTNGTADYDAVHAIQVQYRLTPLSAWGSTDYTPPRGTVDASVDMATPPPVQVDKMTAQQFYGLFSDLCIDNPPGPHDYPMIHRLERTGLILGQHFDLSSAAPQIQLAFDRATTDGNALVAQLGRQAAGEGSAGWVYSTTGGAGVDYNNRAAVAYYALGMNLPQDAVYPSASADSDGQPLDGRDSYVLHLDTAPPVDAFWSVTAYDADGYFISNPIGRQALGDRDPLAVNTDGSIDIYIQAASPDTAKAPNWLPVAEAPFTLLIRLYSPRDEVLTKAWTPPPLRRQGQPH